jgi:hypothetical protein
MGPTADHRFAKALQLRVWPDFPGSGCPDDRHAGPVDLPGADEVEHVLAGDLEGCRRARSAWPTSSMARGAEGLLTKMVVEGRVGLAERQLGSPKGCSEDRQGRSGSGRKLIDPPAPSARRISGRPKTSLIAG